MFCDFAVLKIEHKHIHAKTSREKYSQAQFYPGVLQTISDTVKNPNFEYCNIIQIEGTESNMVYR